jgi:hypothetical protein
MPDDLYERDILTWAEQQAALLHRLANGERVNDAVDWPHVIEELHDVGLSELRACESLLRQALVHLLKLHAWPAGPAAHWRGEIVGFLADAQSRFAPSMRQRIDVDALYRKALRQLRAEAQYGPGPMLPDTCPFTLDALLADAADPADLAALLSIAPPTGADATPAVPE